MFNIYKLYFTTNGGKSSNQVEKWDKNYAKTQLNN